jgi:HEPN domain-containing protein
MDTKVATSAEGVASETNTTEGDKESEVDLFEQEIILNPGDSTKLCTPIIDKDSEEIQSIFAVSDNPDQTKDYLADIADKANSKIPKKDITVVDEATYRMLQSLAEKGLITINDSIANPIFKTESLSVKKPDITKQKVKIARDILSQAERKLKMAKVLLAGGFEAEAIPPARESVAICANSLSILPMMELPEIIPEQFDATLLDSLKKELRLKDELYFLIKDCEKNEISANVDYIAASTELLGEAERIINEKSLSY